MTGIIVYYIYAFSFFSMLYLYYRINRKQRKQIQFEAQESLVYLNIRHLLASLVMCIAMLASVFQPNTETDFLLFTWNEGYSGLTYTLYFLAFTISGITAKNEGNEKIHGINRNEKIFYLGIRVVFLIVYEFYFRIILLQAFYFLPITYAVVINVLLYSAAHAFSGKKEIIGSVPFGFALCLLTILHQSVWPAIILHFILSFTYEGIKLYSKNLNFKTIIK